MCKNMSRLSPYQFSVELELLKKTIDKFPLECLSDLFPVVRETREEFVHPPIWKFWARSIGVVRYKARVMNYSLGKFTLTEILDSLYEIEHNIEKTKIMFPIFRGGRSYLLEYKRAREKFIEKFTTYQHPENQSYYELGRSEKQRESLIEVADTLAVILSSLRFLCSTVLDSIGTERVQVDSGFKKFSLHLPTVSSYPKFSEKVTSFMEIYDETCQLFAADESSADLIPLRVEYGSSFIEVIGNEKVLGLIVASISAVAAYLYKCYTSQEKARLTAKSIENIDAMLGLTLKLKEAGIDVSKHNEQISKSAYKLIRSYDLLLDDQIAIELDKQFIKVHKDVKMILREEKVEPKEPK